MTADVTDRTDEVVLFIHSTGTGPALWRRVPPGILGGRRPLMPANVGYAPNPRLERGAPFVAADDAAEVRRALAADAGAASARKIHLVAHSYGALVALLLMKDPAFSATVASAFLYEPVPFGSLTHPSADGVADPEGIAEARGFLAEPWFLDDEERGGRDEWLERFVDYWNRPGSWADMPEFIREETLALGWKMFQEVRSCFRIAMPFAEWAFPGPTTVAYGQRSPKASQAMARALATGRDGVTTSELANVGHMAPLTHPAIVHRALEAHLARV